MSDGTDIVIINNIKKGISMHKFLESIGMTEYKQSVYLALLQLGSATATQISKMANVKRPTTYDTLYELIGMGLASEVHANNKHYFLAENPNKLEEIVTKMRKEFAVSLPYLSSIYNSGGEKPDVAYYAGIDGIKNVCDDILKMPENSEVLGYVTSDVLRHPEMEEYLKYFVKKRVERSIKFRGVYNPSLKIDKWLEKSDKHLREYRAVSKDHFPFRDEINIYGNKMAIMSYGERPFGVIIGSKSVADTQRSIFELVWRSLN